jgi:hypothetical protein
LATPASWQIPTALTKVRWIHINVLATKISVQNQSSRHHRVADAPLFVLLTIVLNAHDANLDSAKVGGPQYVWFAALRVKAPVVNYQSRLVACLQQPLQWITFNQDSLARAKFSIHPTFFRSDLVLNSLLMPLTQGAGQPAQGARKNKRQLVLVVVRRYCGIYCHTVSAFAKNLCVQMRIWLNYHSLPGPTMFKEQGIAVCFTVVSPCFYKKQTCCTLQ